MLITIGDVQFLLVDILMFMVKLIIPALILGTIIWAMVIVGIMGRVVGTIDTFYSQIRYWPWFLLFTYAGMVVFGIVYGVLLAKGV